MARVSLAEADPKAVCNNGEPAAYYRRLAPNSSSWFVWLEGGGWCWSNISCHMRSKRRGQRGSAPGFPSLSSADLGRDLGGAIGQLRVVGARIGYLGGGVTEPFGRTQPNKAPIWTRTGPRQGQGVRYIAPVARDERGSPPQGLIEFAVTTPSLLLRCLGATLRFSGETRTSTSNSAPSEQCRSNLVGASPCPFMFLHLGPFSCPEVSSGSFPASPRTTS